MSNLHTGHALSAVRENSRQALAEMLEMLGLPESYATELEQFSYERGKVWSWVSD
jgi:hypothetical protein